MYKGDILTNELLLFQGKPWQITEDISVKNPTLREISDFGEDNYWSLITHLCATSFDYRLPLQEDGIDYLDIDDWHMFLYTYLTFDPEDTKVLIPDLNISSLLPAEKTETKEIVLLDSSGKEIINQEIYAKIVTFIRDCHGLERNFKVPGNAAARAVYMQDAMDARMNAGRKAPSSVLSPLVSSLCNREGFKYNFETVWDLSIYAFMDATRRISKIDAANHFANGIYSGNLDLSKMNKTQLNKNMNWMGEL